MKRNMSGFTLIELMIVVAIIAIISAIGYPSYQDHVRKVNRTDAIETLTDTSVRLERCFTAYGSYNNASCKVPDEIESSREHYTITVERTSGTFNLTAEPLSALQKKDTICTELKLDNTGKKSSEPTGSKCW